MKGLPFPFVFFLKSVNSLICLFLPLYQWLQVLWMFANVQMLVWCLLQVFCFHVLKWCLMNCRWLLLKVHEIFIRDIRFSCCVVWWYMMFITHTFTLCAESSVFDWENYFQSTQMHQYINNKQKCLMLWLHKEIKLSGQEPNQ